jgi:hypothetical protein
LIFPFPFLGERVFHLFVNNPKEMTDNPKIATRIAELRAPACQRLGARFGGGKFRGETLDGTDWRHVLCFPGAAFETQPLAGRGLYCARRAAAIEIAGIPAFQLCEIYRALPPARLPPTVDSGISKGCEPTLKKM